MIRLRLSKEKRPDCHLCGSQKGRVDKEPCNICASKIRHMLDFLSEPYLNRMIKKIDWKAFGMEKPKYISQTASKYCKGRGLDIGAGRRPFRRDTIPIDRGPDQHAHKLNYEDKSLDYIFSSHTLEHLRRWKSALKLWIRKLKLEGILFLYLPHEDMFIWRPTNKYGRSFGHRWQPTKERICPFLEKNGMEIIEASERDKTWSFYIVARRTK